MLLNTIKLEIILDVLKVGGSKFTASLFGQKLLETGFLIYFPVLFTFVFHIDFILIGKFVLII